MSDFQPNPPAVPDPVASPCTTPSGSCGSTGSTGSTPSRRLLLQIAIYISGNAVSSVGNWVYIVALNILMLQRTHSALAVSGLWIVPFVANAVVGGWAGSVTDRMNQRKLLVTMDLIRAITVAIVPFTSSVWFIYALIFIEDAAGMFFGQAALPFRTRLVPQSMRKRVNGLMGSFQSGAMLLGPAIAGGLMYIGSPSFAIWANALSFFISALSLFLLPNLGELEAVGSREKAEGPVGPARAWSTRLSRLREDWRQSASFLQGNRFYLLVVCAFTLIGILAQGANSVEVVFAQDALHLGKVGYSTMVMSAGVGVLAGSVIVTALSSKLSTRVLLAGGMSLSQLAYLLYALSIGLWTSVATLVPLGIANAAEQVGYQTYIQDALPTEQMGRITSILVMPISILTVISIALTGFVTGHVPVRHTMVALTTASTVIALFASVVMFRRWNRRVLPAQTQAGEVEME